MTTASTDGTDERAADDDVVRSESDTRSAAGPSRWVHLLIVMAWVIGVLSGINVWVDQQLLDTDNWVDASDDLLADENVRQVLAAYLVDELYAAVDVAEELGTRLPDEIDGLAGLLAGALREPATEAVARLLGTDELRELWRGVNRSAHGALVRVLEDDTGAALSTSDGDVTLDLAPLVRRVGLDLGLSSDVLDRLPDDIGRLTIFESDALDNAQAAVRLIEVLSVVLFLVVLGLYCAGVYLARSWRREAVREVGLALGVSGMVVLVALRIVSNAAERTVADTPAAQQAANLATAVGTAVLRDIALAALAFGLLIIGFAALVGPTGPARRLRAWAAPVLVASPVVTWSAAIGVFLLLAYLFPGEPLRTWWRTLIFVTLFVVALGSVRRHVREERPEPDEGGELAR